MLPKNTYGTRLAEAMSAGKTNLLIIKASLTRSLRYHASSNHKMSCSVRRLS